MDATPNHSSLTRRILGGAAVLCWSWFLMMAVHEVGHAVAARATGGKIRQIELKPLTISRTDVQPNPHPLIVVWAGPVAGCVLPLIALGLSHRKSLFGSHVAFFAGFCLIANGAYIGGGGFDQIGDCRTMLQEGSPLWSLILFGVSAILAGFWIWHTIKSFRTYLTFPDFAAIHPAWSMSALLVLAAFQLGLGT